MSIAKRPRQLLFRDVKPNWGGLFTKLGGVVGSPTPKGIVGGTLAAFQELFKLKPPTLEEQVFLLIQRALVRSVASLVQLASESLGRSLTIRRREVTSYLDAELDRITISVDDNFFKNPTRLPLLGAVTRWLSHWLEEAGCSAEDVRPILSRLPGTFADILAAEYRENQDRYLAIVQVGDVPQFAQGAAVEQRWTAYAARLQVDSNPEVLDLGVRLDQIYVPPRAYWERASSRQTGLQAEAASRTRVVGLLEDFAMAWLDEDPRDAIKVISGGPGSGKSMFARRFAAATTWAIHDPWRVLYVPLHRFQVERDLADAVSAFAARELDPQSRAQPFDLFGPNAPDRLLLIFDGLDELSKQGKVGAQDAADFMTQVETLVKAPAGGARQLKVLVCGRPVAVDLSRTANRREGRVLHVLPFVVERLPGNRNYEGETALLELDHRVTWWGNYQRTRGEPETGLPPELAKQRLQPLTAEPLLMALLARLLCGRPGREITETTNRSLIYEWLLQDIFDRLHDPAGKVHVPDLKFDEFVRLLEEVAVAAWHGGDLRGATQAQVLKRCERAGLTPLLGRVFPADGRADVTALFLAFYFRQLESDRGHDPAFEFTHKSFGEYLLARRMVRFLGELRRYLLDSPAWTDEEALRRWVDLFGPASLDPDLFDFLRESIELRPKDEVRECQRAVVQLLNAALRSGLPMHSTSPLLGSFLEMNHQAVRAEHSLFAVHSACSSLTGSVGEIRWKHADEAQRWLLRLLGGGEKVLDYLNRLSFQGQRFTHLDLAGANLRGVNLHSASLGGVNLGAAKLCEASLQRADLRLSRLPSADLRDASLAQANLNGADLRGADLRGADLTGAQVDGALLSGTQYLDRQLAETEGTPTELRDGTSPKPTFRNKLKAKTVRSKQSRPSKPSPDAGG